MDVTREFDLITKRFVPTSEGGFEQSAAKSSLSWIGSDTVFAVTDFGPGGVSSSGYPLQVRHWHWRMLIPEADLAYRGEPTDMQVGMGHDHVSNFVCDWVYWVHSFYDYDLLLLNPDNSLSLVDIPSGYTTAPCRDLLLLAPRTDWEVDDVLVSAGSLAATRLELFLPGWEGEGPRVWVLFVPSKLTLIADFFITRNSIVITVQEGARTYPLIFHHDGKQ